MVNENDSEVTQTKEVGQVQEEQTVEPEGKIEPEEIIEPPTDAHCPSCNGPGIRKGKTILCELCDCTFRYTKEGPKVEDVGPLEKRVARLERFAGEAEPKRAQPAEPEVAQPAEIQDDGI